MQGDNFYIWTDGKGIVRLIHSTRLPGHEVLSALNMGRSAHDMSFPRCKVVARGDISSLEWFSFEQAGVITFHQWVVEAIGFWITYTKPGEMMFCDNHGFFGLFSRGSLEKIISALESDTDAMRHSQPMAVVAEALRQML